MILLKRRRHSLWLKSKHHERLTKKGETSSTPNWENKSRLVSLKNETHCVTSITFRRWWWWWIDVNYDNYQKRWKKTWLNQYIILQHSNHVKTQTTNNKNSLGYAYVKNIIKVSDMIPYQRIKHGINWLDVKNEAIL